MASYHLSVKSVSRATGRSAPGAAAYRTASRIACERDGTVHDYRRRAGVAEAFVVAPEGAPAWALDRAALWNAAEAAERRKDAKVAREYELALPHELDGPGRRTLAEGFAREVAARFGVAADVAIHEPGREGDRRNWHAHVLTTTRVVGPEGLGAKTRELDVAATSGALVEELRASWAARVNRALEAERVEARVEHRSYARRGVDRVAEQHLGPGAAALERKAGAARARERERAAAGARPTPGAGQEGGKERVAALVGLAAAPGGAEEATQLERTPEAAVTRIGAANAAVRERNAMIALAWHAAEVAREGFGRLERAAEAGRRWVSGLARGVGGRLSAEREAAAARAATLEAERAREREAAAEALRRSAAVPGLAAGGDAGTLDWWRGVAEGGRAKAQRRPQDEPHREQQGPRLGM